MVMRLSGSCVILSLKASNASLSVSFPIDNAASIEEGFKVVGYMNKAMQARMKLVGISFSILTRLVEEDRGRGGCACKPSSTCQLSRTSLYVYSSAIQRELFSS